MATNSPVLSIVGGGSTLKPTAAQFRAWPPTTIVVDGASYTGVTLAYLSQVMGAPSLLVEIEGVRPDGTRYAIGRHALSDVGDSSILVLSRTGHVDLVSSSLDPSQWLTFVTAVSFP